jgi:NADH-ubiquinone oxidoreductase chain 5
MNLPMLILSIGSIISGYIFNDLILGYGSTIFNNSIYIHPLHNIILDILSYSTLFYFIPIFFLILFILIIPFKFNLRNNKNIILPIINLNNTNNNLNNSWKYNKIIDLYIMNNFNIINYRIIQNYFNLSIIFYRYLDKGILEIFGPLGIFRILHYIGFKIEILSTGNILHQISII